MIERVARNNVLFKATDAFAAYSLPKSTKHVTLTGVIQEKVGPKGSFVIQKFDKEGRQPIFLEANTIYHNQPFLFDCQETSKLKSTHQDDYLKIVQQTIDAIRNGEFKKVVMSKIKTIPIKEPLSQTAYFKIFDSLKKMYPNAFVFLYHIPGEGCWCGATPEVLLNAGADVYTTMALAGTQVDMDIPLDQVVWGVKEIEEQRIIEEFVTGILVEKEIQFEKTGPDTIKAGRVLHLQSTFEMTPTTNPIQLADSLHPGPAICGIPLPSSRTWIKDKEEHEREHYCGYIGPWNISGHSSLFINLRSMRVYLNQFVLFLGGGLTDLSHPSSEWEETELKAQTLLQVLEKIAING